MAENKFGGLDAFADHLIGGQDDENSNVLDPEELKQKLESLDEPTPSETEDNDKDKDKSDPDKGSEEDTDTDEEEDDKSKSTPDKTEKTTTDDESDDEGVELEEEDLVDAFSDVFSQELGWEFDENEKPKSVKDLVKYMQEIIDTNSVPKYPNEEIKALAEYVQNGGNVRDFAAKVYGSEVDIDSVDLTKEGNQKAVIRENLRSKGYSEVRIDKLINRYEEAGSLEEEANDSLEEVKSYKEQQKATLLEQKKLEAREMEKQQLAFVQNVEKQIADTTEVRGVQISSKDKKDLMEYIFKPEADGMTRYQKDYNSNLSNLVESAYFTMKGDKLVKQLQQKATTDATKTLKLKLKSKGKSTKNTMPESDTQGSKVGKLWDIASRELNNFNN